MPADRPDWASFEKVVGGRLVVRLLFARFARQRPSALIPEPLPQVSELQSSLSTSQLAAQGAGEPKITTHTCIRILSHLFAIAGGRLGGG